MRFHRQAQWDRDAQAADGTCMPRCRDYPESGAEENFRSSPAPQAKYRSNWIEGSRRMFQISVECAGTAGFFPSRKKLLCTHLARVFEKRFRNRESRFPDCPAAMARPGACAHRVVWRLSAVRLVAMNDEFRISAAAEFMQVHADAFSVGVHQKGSHPVEQREQQLDRWQQQAQQGGNAH